MSSIIARTYCGGKDLFHGIPDLVGAVVIEVVTEPITDEYRTKIVLKDKRGKLHEIIIVQNV